MARRRRGILGEERGDTLVEFALASGVFFMTMFGIVSFSLAVWKYNMVANLAQEGARWASVRGSTASTPATNGSVQAFVSGRALGMNVTATTTWPGGGNAPGKTVQVRVQQTFVPITAFVPSATMTLRSTAQMIIAR